MIGDMLGLNPQIPPPRYQLISPANGVAHRLVPSTEPPIRVWEGLRGCLDLLLLIDINGQSRSHHRVV